MRQLKGFALRRPGRPLGSRAIDRHQSDFFPVEKLLSQCGWQKFRGEGEGCGGAAAAPPETRKRLYVPVTRKVSLKNETFAGFVPRKVSPEIRKKGGIE